MTSSGNLIFVDGKPVTPSDGKAALFDENFVSVFETMRIVNKVVFRQKDHVSRLFQSAKTAGLEIGKSREEIEKELREILSSLPSNDQFFIRFMVTDRGSLAFVFQKGYPREAYEKGVDLITATVRRNSSNSFPPEAKTGLFMNGILATLDPAAKNAFDALYLDEHGYLKEARVWNFFIVRRGGLKTPAPVGILDGVTRRFVIECARKEGFETEETCLTRHDVWSAEEAFLTNAVGGIIPVRSLDKRLIGREIPGPVTRRLIKSFEREIGAE